MKKSATSRITAHELLKNKDADSYLHARQLGPEARGQGAEDEGAGVAASPGVGAPLHHQVAVAGRAHNDNSCVMICDV